MKKRIVLPEHFNGDLGNPETSKMVLLVIIKYCHKELHHLCFIYLCIMVHFKCLVHVTKPNEKPKCVHNEYCHYNENMSNTNTVFPI